MQVGGKGIATDIVSHKNTADTAKSGLLPVYSTPALVALMECASIAAIEPEMEAGQTSVGTRIDVQHTAATPIGMQVRAEAEIVKIDGRAVVFHIEAFDEVGPIGTAEHHRYIVYAERFMQKVEAKSK